jgi:8-oxo-dGTP diphosphatase
MTVIGTLCFIENGDQLLLINKKNGFGAGKIVAPGGKKKDNENLEECIIREVKEDVGLNVEGEQQFLYIYSNLSKLIL